MTIVRFTGLFLFIAVTAGALLVALRKLPALRSSRRHMAGALGATLAILLGIGTYTLTVSDRQSQAWVGVSGLSEKTYRTLYAVAPGLNAPFYKDVVASLPTDAPPCLRTVPDQFAPGVDVWTNLTRYGQDSCSARDRRWMEHNYARLMLGYWISDPVSAGRWVVEGSRAASTQSAFPQAASIVPESVSVLFFSPGPSYRGPSLGNAAALWGIAFVLVASATLALRSARRMPALLMVTLTLGAWFSFGASYMDIWDSHARKAWPFWFLAVAGTALLVAQLTDALLQRRETGRA